jgi:hypothetical protein
MKIKPLLGAIIFLSGLTIQAAAPPPIKRVEIRDAGLYVNGEPFFPIGVDHAAHWHYSLPEAGAQGFNVVTTHGLKEIPHSYRYDIDEAYANGMYSVALLTNSVWENLETVEQIILACRNAPGLLAWGLEHEPNLLTGARPATTDIEPPYRMPPATFKPLYEMIKRLDPHHPIHVELAYGNLNDHQRYTVVADIHNDMCRPVPHAPLAAVAAYTDNVIKGAAGKPGWMELQMMAIGGRNPTIAEVRCMTYMGIAHGLSGIIYKAFHYGEWWVTDSPGYWVQWADLTSELRLLTPHLVTAEVAGLQTEIIEGTSGDGALGYTALHTSLRKTEQGYFLIAVNGFDEPVRGRFTIPVPENGLTLQAAVRFEKRLIEITEGVFEDGFGPYEVHLYEFFDANKIDREIIDWPLWQRRPRR